MDFNRLSKFICHRRPERSFFFHNHQFPVCARCTGLYITMIIYLIYAYFIPIHYTQLYLYTAILLIIPCLVDGTTQALKLRESNNKLRLITGLLAGIGIMIILKMIKLTMWR
ncbi:DUF2085 domain-containing protein [Methanosphaera cuniculi]|uniref:DUF2085 domain-containing protein n=1 Tax=Methanosphaera cuniculi TaxID=1077256 RepID=A0A2A2HEW5_9EURY|nr:DUF2085 domain-containing protein [Methanosphaera cuniculi]PAV07972.1 hypothetical protein ASJ82_01660 [Methanosphaera cuniculi]PWL08822.1 hypothetical protein MSCUN_02600 [Methanosphaera cuniculi]